MLDHPDPDHTVTTISYTSNYVIIVGSERDGSVLQPPTWKIRFWILILWKRSRWKWAAKVHAHQDLMIHRQLNQFHIHRTNLETGVLLDWSCLCHIVRNSWTKSAFFPELCRTLQTVIEKSMDTNSAMLVRITVKTQQVYQPSRLTLGAQMLRQ